MITTIIFLSAWLLDHGQCKFDGVEINRLEFSPFYDTIIFKDIADIIDDFDNNMNFQQDADIESDEDIENLLAEYQHYLYKAHQQRLQYFEKNKIPFTRHEKIGKTHTSDRNRNYYSNINFPQNTFNSPFDLFLPIHKHIDSINRSESSHSKTAGNTGNPLYFYDKIVMDKNKNNYLPSTAHTSDSAIVPSCFCEENKFPCKCNCKQCLIPLGKSSNFYEPIKPFDNDSPFINLGSYKNIGYSNEKINDRSDINNFNIRFKIDIQIPKLDDVLRKVINFDSNKRTLSETERISEAVTPLNISFPLLDFPFPIKMFNYNGLSKFHQYDASPLHKLILHKKKKSRKMNKKHHTKFLPFHHTKGDFYQTEVTEKYNVYSESLNNSRQFIEENVEFNNTQLLGSNMTTHNMSNESLKINATNENAYMPFLLNISNNDNLIIEPIKIGTTINKNDTKLLPNIPSIEANYTRIKRETVATTELVAADRNIVSNSNISKINTTTINLNKDYNIFEKHNEQVSLNNDLLYWPSKIENNASSMLSVATKYHNIHVSEIKPNISNMLREKMVVNINEKDINGVTNIFTYVVGKYVNGILTFCSANFCRSVKCGKKICIYRNCFSKDRFDQKGHCVSQNSTDYAISMESAPDSSPNIAFELIDTLQKKMLGQMFGKATICINLKCMTFVTIKKNFIKAKCLKKELNPGGHCPYLKNVKVVKVT